MNILDIIISNYAYKTFRISGSPGIIHKKLASILESGGLKFMSSMNGTMLFRYPSLFFSSKRPLTYISRLVFGVRQENGRTQVRVGINFARIKCLIAALIFVLCFVIPLLIGYWFKGKFDLAPTSGIGIPVGILLYFHVRARVFRLMKRLVQKSGE